ncbi:DUF58 domain-containing protein [Natronoglycomyces albus]|uniref:DUF58 domain-containing protein n=1 Tax=Natronoglycomyces albus TaxID=2811108 RepID=A0A895XQZ7_9ACTN|nr:DUF58 domain-containing protein [Natronoglycomyces albus]QSB05943.1 DUF58 domain-containing protein [Natronoglycomyces albus]
MSLSGVPAAAATPATRSELAFFPTRALRRSLGLIILLAVLTIMLGRVEFVIALAPFAIGLAALLGHVPTIEPTAQIKLSSEASFEGSSSEAVLRLHNEAEVPVVVHSALDHGQWLTFTQGTNYADVVKANSVRERRVPFTMNRWGSLHIGPAYYRALACGGLLEATRQVAAPKNMRSTPTAMPTDLKFRMPDARGFVGPHRSTLHGDAAELAEVRYFQPGDRLRRIDWRSSARSQHLYVNATESERDVDVTLVLDTTSEAGTSAGVKGAASVLDLTVRSAFGVTAHFTEQGDRVALWEYAPHARHLRSGTGRRQQEAAGVWLTKTMVAEHPSPVDPRRYLSMLRSGQGLIIVFTPLLSNSPLDFMGLLASTGRSLLCVDTLPRDLQPNHVSEQALRLWHLERENLLADLEERGVHVLTPTRTAQGDRLSFVYSPATSQGKGHSYGAVA